MTFTVEFEREDDGRWLAEVLELPGVLAYGHNSDEAIAKAQLWPCAPWQIGSNLDISKVGSDGKNQTNDCC